MTKKHFRDKIAFFVKSCPFCGHPRIPVTRTRNGSGSIYCERCKTRVFFNSDLGIQGLREMVGVMPMERAIEDAAMSMAYDDADS